MHSLTLQPVARIAGEIQIPGSKSLSNRILLLAAIASGNTNITNLLDSDDIAYMLAALKTLGVQYQLAEHKHSCIVHGIGGAFNRIADELFVGNAGTVMRPLTAVLAASNGDWLLTGAPRMQQRPIKDLIDALRHLGAEIEYQRAPGYPPLKIKATGLQGGGVKIPGNISSQFITALLMAAPLAKNPITIDVEGALVSKPYIDITLQVMRAFGVQVDNHDYRQFVVDSRQHYQSPGEIRVEGDASSASYFLAAAAIKGGTVRVNGIGADSVQGDRLFGAVLAAMGATIKYQPTAIEATCNGRLKAIDMDLNHIPDAAMTIGVVALFADGTSVIRNIYNWRLKETDRLTAMATELEKVGAKVEQGNDYLAITPPPKINCATIDTYDDHRMAMSFSLAALGDAPITINDPDCTAKTFPAYFELFQTICEYDH